MKCKRIHFDECSKLKIDSSEWGYIFWFCLNPTGSSVSALIPATEISILHIHKVAKALTMVGTCANLWKPLLSGYIIRCAALGMAKIFSPLVIVGALAAAALVIPAMLGPAVFQQAEAARDTRQDATAFARGVVAAAANVQADVDVDNNNVCVVAETCTTGGN
jgi:hypothetical protein